MTDESNNPPAGEAADLGDALAGITAGGLPLESGLRALVEEMPSGRMSRALSAVSDRLSRGEPLQRILEDNRDAPPLLKELLRCGLATGNLGEVLASWLNDTRRAGDVRRKILGGLAYPAVLLGFLIVVFTVFATVIMPGMRRHLFDFNIELPALTRFVFSLSSGLRHYGLWILSGLLVLGLLTVFWPAMFGRGYLFRRRLLCAVPVIGSANRFASLSTFCRLLAELIQHRVPLPAAVRAAGNGARDAVLEMRCEELAGKIEQGLKLDQAALTIREFPSQLVYAFRSADHPESFADTLRGTAEMCEAQARLRAGMVPLIAEPVVISGIALTLILVVIAIFFPLIMLLNSLT